RSSRRAGVALGSRFFWALYEVEIVIPPLRTRSARRWRCALKRRDVEMTGLTTRSSKTWQPRRLLGPVEAVPESSDDELSTAAPKAVVVPRVPVDEGRIEDWIVRTLDDGSGPRREGLWALVLDPSAIRRRAPGAPPTVELPTPVWNRFHVDKH